MLRCLLELHWSLHLYWYATFFSLEFGSISMMCSVWLLTVHCKGGLTVVPIVSWHWVPVASPLPVWMHFGISTGVFTTRYRIWLWITQLSKYLKLTCRSNLTPVLSPATNDTAGVEWTMTKHMHVERRFHRAPSLTECDGELPRPPTEILKWASYSLLGCMQMTFDVSYIVDCWNSPFWLHCSHYA